MFQSNIGEWAAFITAVFWTITALAFQTASRRIGDFPVNWIRLVLGLFFLSIFTWTRYHLLFPINASAHTWIWLSLSGLIGFTFGDLCLFRAFVLIGARISMLVMALVPPMTTLLGWIIMGEVLTPLDLTGMFLTVTGISLVVMQRHPDGKRIQLSHPLKGLLFALGGAAGQSIGLILSKYGMGSYSAFQATQIRIIAGLLGLTLLYFPLRQWRPTFLGVKDKKGVAFAGVGAFFGPFLGVSFSLIAVKYALAGVASTIMALVPVFIIPPAIFIFKERVTLIEIVGAVIAVGGVALLFLQ